MFTFFDALFRRYSSVKQERTGKTVNAENITENISLHTRMKVSKEAMTWAVNSP